MKQSLWIATSLGVLCISALAQEAEPVQELQFYPGEAGETQFAVWNMEQEERDGRLYLNADCEGRPWAGVNFESIPDGGRRMTFTPDWLENGYVRFRVNALDDAYGQPTVPCAFQVRVIGSTSGYGRVRDQFYEGDRIDRDPETWQTALVPLDYLGVGEAETASGVSIQCVNKPVSAFAISDVSLVRYAERLGRDADRVNVDVAQPWVNWPAFSELPGELRPETNRPMLHDGTFVTADDRRTFLIMPWSRENQALNLGLNEEGEPPPDYGLYDPETQGFIYEEPLSKESMARLGFNCYSGMVNPRAFWDVIGYPGDPWQNFERADFVEFVRRLDCPIYIDLVCFPWTLGRPAGDADADLPDGVLHNGNRHWTPYRIIGPGRDMWLTMWRAYAERYRDAGADVLFVELFNEPAYSATTPDHRAEFVEWLRERYGTLDNLNGTWRTDYASWEALRQFGDQRDSVGLFLDYDEYLADRFADLVRAGQAAVDEILPGVPAATQTMGGYCLQPREAIHLQKLIPVQGAVITPTGGGRWTNAVPNARPHENTIEYGIGASPITNDLLLAMSGTKMIVDNEAYLRGGQTRGSMRDRFWQSVLTGLDGAAWFSWSKRGWAWRAGKENVLREADLFPYSNLIPFARRADAIRGVLLFAKEMELVREYVLPKPWGPEPDVALIYSWASARRRSWEPGTRDRTGKYHAAMRYLHWDLETLPSHMASPERLARRDIVVAGGLDFVEPELLEALRQYVETGGDLLVGDGLMDRDMYGNALDSGALLGVEDAEEPPARPDAFRVVGLPASDLLPGEIRHTAGVRAVNLRPGAEVIYADADGRPVLTGKAMGEGKVYFLAADLRGYPLAKILDAVRRGMGSVPGLSIRDAGNGQLAPNVLVSRRSYDDHHALLLRNSDGFAKDIRIHLRGLAGDWYVSAPLEGRALRAPDRSMTWSGDDLADAGFVHALKPSGFALILLTREPWTKSELRISAAG